MKRSLRNANRDEIRQWDNLLVTNPYGADPFQAKALSELKRRRGWKIEFWVYETEAGPIYATVYIRKIASLGRIVYIPRGPSVIDPKQWSEICGINRKNLTDVIAVRMEPPIVKGKLKVLRDDLVKVGDIQKSVVNTAIINLDQSEDELWDSFRQRARRSIRGGRKEQLTISEGAYSPKNVDLMWGLYKVTASRAGIKTRPKEYYAEFWQEYIDRDQGRFFFVWEPGGERPIAGAFVCFLGDIALYKDGGSRRDTRAHFSHLLHWQIMLHLKNKGFKRYDLGGTPPSDQLDDPSHRLASLATFKLSFGAPVIDHIGTYDQILKPRQYKIWRLLERAWRDVLWRTRSRDIY